MFDLLVATLGRLSVAAEMRLPTRYFELQLLELAGFRPQLFECLGCGQAIQPTVNYFQRARGGVLCPACGADAAGASPISLPALKVLRYMQTRDYDLIAPLQLRETVHREVEEILYHYITFVLEKSLKSVRFLHLLREQLALSAGMAGAAQTAEQT